MTSGSLPAFAGQIEKLRHRLARPLPGRSAMMAMSPSGRPFVAAEEARSRGCREAGALVLLYPVQDQAYTVLTLRGNDLPEHAGQVSLPGGQLNPGEAVAAGALREAAEELGIPRQEVELIGRLSPIYISPTNYLVSPVVGITTSRPDFQPHPVEVAAVIEVPLERLCARSARRVETWQIRGEQRQVPFFALGDHKVWGATAMVLGELAVVWAEAIGIAPNEPQG